jgi:hypothetical protein
MISFFSFIIFLIFQAKIFNFLLGTVKKLCKIAKKFRFVMPIAMESLQ